MLLTEDEAKERWCPFARVSATGQGNRYPMDIDLAEGHAFARCIASQCMAWRGTTGVYDRKENRFIGERESWSPGERYEERDAGHGYCGLAGRP